MDYPNVHHHHHHRRDDDEEEQRFPPPPQPHLPYGNQPSFPPQQGFGGPPPPQPFYRNEEEPPRYPIQSHHHQGPPPPSFNQFGGGEQEDYGYRRPSPPNPQPDYEPGYGGGGGGGFGGYSQSPGYASEPPRRESGGYPQTQEPDYPSVQHVGHERYDNQGFDPVRHEVHHKPHLPIFSHDQSGGGSGFPSNTPTVRVYSKAEPNYSLTIRDGQVILARSDGRDPYQHWIKDEKYSVRVKDEEGFPSFSLVNKATGLAMKHSTGATHPVQLVPYNPDVLDQSVLWTESRDLGDTYRTIRQVNNIRLNVDALNGDANHGGVRDGTTIVLWEWKKGDNQRWKIVPYCKSSDVSNQLDH